MNRHFAALLATPVLVLGTALAIASPAAAAGPKCGDFKYQEDAQAYFDAHPGSAGGLDRDKDGIACETLPRRPGGGTEPGGGSGPGEPATPPCPSASPSATPSPVFPRSPSSSPSPSPEESEPTPEPSESSETPAPNRTKRPKPKPAPVVPQVEVSPTVPAEPIEEPVVTESPIDAPGGGGFAPCPPAPGGGSESDGDLPVTGASLGTGIAAGLMLLLTGGAAVLLARRRKFPATR